MRYVLAWCSVCFVVGVWAWPFWEPSLKQLQWAILGMLVLLFSLRSRTSITSFFPLYVSAFCLGGTCCARYPDPLNDYTGSLIGDVRFRVGKRALVSSSKGRFWLVFYEDAPKEGERFAAWVSPKQEPISLPGDPNPTWRRKRARAGYLKVKDWVPFRPRDRESRFEDSIYPNVTHGGLLWSLMSGERGWIAEETKKLLQDTGTAHYLAISGMHIGFVALLVYGIARGLVLPLLWFQWWRLALWIPYVCSCSAAIGYANHVGWPASAQRSVIFVLAASLAMVSGRSLHPWTILLFAAAYILYIEPAHLDTLGYQLSFVSVAGILFWTPRITRLIPLDIHPLLHKMIVSAAISVGASLGTLPLIVWHFQKFPLNAPITNMVVAPFLGVVAVPFALLAQILPEPLNGGSLVIADAAVTVAVFLLSMLQLSVWKPATGLFGVITLFVILSFRRRETWVLFSLIIFFCIFPRRKDGFRVVFLPIGQGDAALVEWSDGRTWLIDAGPPSRSLLRYLRRRGIQKLERVFLSHPHRDHMGGLDSLVGELDIERFWSPRPPIAGELEYRRLWRRMIKHGVQMQSEKDLSGSDIRLLHPLNGWSGGGKDAVNEQSLVLELQHGDHRFLFTGDVGQHAESLLVKEGRLFQGYDVVKVAHHGSRYSSSDAFIKRVQAEYAVISCGIKNRFGHPHTATLWRWRKSRILRSDQQGLIEFESDGKTLRVRTWNWESGWKSLPRNRKE